MLKLSASIIQRIEQRFPFSFRQDFRGHFEKREIKINETKLCIFKNLFNATIPTKPILFAINNINKFFLQIKVNFLEQVQNSVT